MNVFVFYFVKQVSFVGIFCYECNIYYTHMYTQTQKRDKIVRFGLLKTVTIFTKRRARINGEIKVIFIEILAETFIYLMILERITC